MDEDEDVWIRGSWNWWLAVPVSVLGALNIGLGVWMLVTEGWGFGLVSLLIGLLLAVVFWTTARREVRLAPSGITQVSGPRREHLPWSRVRGPEEVTLPRGGTRVVLRTARGYPLHLPGLSPAELLSVDPRRWAGDPVEAGFLPEAGEVTPRVWRGWARSQVLQGLLTAVGLVVCAAAMWGTEDTWGGWPFGVGAVLIALLVPVLARAEVRVDDDGIRVVPVRGQRPRLLTWASVVAVEERRTLLRGHHLVARLDDGLTVALEAVPVTDVDALDPRRWRAGRTVDRSAHASGSR